MALCRLHVVDGELALQLLQAEAGSAGAGDGDRLARELLKVAAGLRRNFEIISFGAHLAQRHNKQIL